MVWLVVAVSVLGLSGCSEQALRPAALRSTTTGATLHGGVMGGQQPVVGATIKLYSVGTSGFQSASSSVLTGTTTSDGNGNFSITGKYTCGSATLVYITATGGTASPFGANANLAMMTALGPCSALSSSSFITINELTTAAAVAALAPYMASTTAIGTSSGGTYTGDEALALAQAFTLAQQYVAQATGTAPGTGVPNGMTVPTQLLNTLADILASCVNSTGGVATDTTTNCGMLFSLATPSGGTAPTDTITAMLNIANHPTANTTALFNQASPQGPFQPELSSAPSSFHVALIPPAGTITRTMYVEPDNGVSFVYTLVTNAASKIDLTMYELVDTTMTADLVNACKRGVVVRVILDQNDEKSSNTTAYNTLNAQAGCSAAWANPAFQVTHQKSMIVDGTQVAIMTLNLVTADYSGTRDFAIVENDPVDIAAIQATFNSDYGSTTDYTYVPALGNDLIWSPTTARGGLVSVINNAVSTLNVENEEMSDATVVAALKAACTRGVTTHIIMTTNSSYTTNLNALKTAGCSVHLFANNASTLYIHAKVIIADAGTAAQYGYMGSINFSTASEVENRELGVFVSDSGLLGTLNTTLNTDYANAPSL